MPIGPQLPPHLLAKRKREEEEEEAEEGSKPTRRRSSSSPSSTEKRRRVVAGPAPPPAPLGQRPPRPAETDETKEGDEEDSSSSDDDDFGPRLPSSASGTKAEAAYGNDADEYDDDYTVPQPEDTKTRRDEWMMVPPKQDDLAARMDPTKLRARGFNTGKSAKGPGQRGGADSDLAWTETPEQKRKRLENQVLGVSKPQAGPTLPSIDLKRQKEDEGKAQRIKDHNDKYRSKTLVAQHQKLGKKEKEDDASARPFDYDKDMAGGNKIGHSQRRELLNRASNFGSKFSGGSYL